jgi:hypothetical protein
MHFFYLLKNQFILLTQAFRIAMIGLERLYSFFNIEKVNKHAFL